MIDLDDTATWHKQRRVPDALSAYHERHDADAHRGVHVPAQQATALREGAREKAVVAAFAHAPSRDEVIFTEHTPPQ